MAISRRWVITIVATVLLTPLVFAAGFALLVWISLSGGLDDAFGNDAPRPGDREVIAAQEAVSGPFLAAVQDNTARIVLPELGSGAALLGRGERESTCVEGQHNWKIDDDFDLICDLPAIEAVKVAHRDDFRDQMVQLDEALRADGWHPSESFGMDRVLTDYWDKLAVNASPGQAPVGYSMDDLPSSSYTLELDGLTRTLAIGWAEQTSGENALGYDLERLDLRTPSGRSVEAAELVGDIPADGYAVVLTHSIEYFHE